MNTWFTTSDFAIDFSVIKTLPDETFWFLFLAAFLFFIYFLYRSYQALTKARTMEDTPTAKIRSAAQGYVELKGTARCLKNLKTLAPLTHRACTWYRYAIERYENKGWTIVENGTSEALFELDDNTDTCIIDPKGAQIELSIHDKWSGFHRHPNGKPQSLLARLFALLGTYRYQEWRIEENTPLYVMGNFHTVSLPTLSESAPPEEYQAKIQASHQLWLNRFTSLLPKIMQNQKISPQEWQDKLKAAYESSTPSNAATINVLSGHALIKRMPFILSSLDENAAIKSAKREAFVWFIAYVVLMALLSSLLIIRLA